jgi:class 3 adenylate cyclase
MTCPTCGNGVAAGQKFCAECGTALAVPCPGCGSPNPPDHRFCPDCGLALQVPDGVVSRAEATRLPPGRLEAPERRFVSVLFADLVGFTPFSEHRDPEDVRAMLTAYFERSRAIVERFSGTVDKFIGDALMAVWGAVEAHEDDAERAVRAAIELVDMVAELGTEIGVPDLRLRAGVLTGETSVGPGGNDQGLVVGDLVNTASRLQSIAEPGTVYVGGPTFELVRHVVEFTPMGEHDLKGKSTSVPVYRAGRIVAAHGGVRRADTVEPPFVGRDDELRLLKDQLHAVGREGRSRLISVIGEAGIGKSRLAWELFKYLDGLPEATYWHQGRSPSYGEGLTFWSLGEMVRRRAGIAETDEPSKSRMKLRTALAEYVPDEEERRWLEPWLAGVLGLDPMPQGDRTELFSVVRTLFHRVAELGQTVLVFEDLHWADQGVVEFIEDLIDRSPRHPILVLALARPDLLERYPSWGAGRHSAASIRLGPLGAGAIAELVNGMAPGMPDPAVQAVVDRAAGVPLYAVEFVRMLVASGDVVRDGDRFRVTGDVAGLAVPDSLQAVIGARIDRLDPRERSLVQDAAVLGQSFTLEGLAALREEPAEHVAADLLGLVRKELLELDDDPRSPERGQYHFVQSVVREVAYGRLSRADRYRTHLRAAAYFEELAIPELAGAVASHFMAAREAAAVDEADELAHRALGALRSAAERAAALHSHEQALALCAQAEEMALTDAERLPFWERAAASSEALADPEGAAAYARRALAYTEAVSDAAGRIRAATLLASILAGNWHADEAVAVLEPVYASLEEPLSEGATVLVAEMGRALMLAQQPERATSVCDRALEAAEQAEMTRTVIDAVITKGMALGNAGRPLEAILLLQGAAELADRHDLPGLAVRSLNNLSVVQSDLDPRASAETWDNLLTRVRRLGDLRWQYQAVNVVTDNLTSEGRYDEALDLLAEIRQEMVPEGFWQTAFDLRESIIVIIRQGALEEVERARELLTYWDDSTDPQLRPAIDLTKAAVDVLAGDWDVAYRRARDVIDASSVYLLWGLRVCAEAAAWQRDSERVADTLERLTASELTGRYAGALRAYLAGAGHALRGDRTAAAEAFAEALDALLRVGTADELVMARTTFAALVGRDHPGAAAASDEAHRWIVDVGATRYLDLYAAGLPPATRSATGTA